MTRLGLHASADPGISDVEMQEFALTKPDIIKVLSYHPADKVRALSATFPNATWIVRAFLDFGGRVISPEKFFTDTVFDVQRTLAAIGPKDKTQVAVELHNEPNIAAEGYGSSWKSGAEFSDWWIALVKRYWDAVPNVRFMFPGLSPGDDVSGIRSNSKRFFQACFPALWHSNGYGIHTYWGAGGLPAGLSIVDSFLAMSQLRCWVTEAANTDQRVSPADKAYEYVQFGHQLRLRSIVQGATIFVASATNPAFASQAWLTYNPKTNQYASQGMGQIVGQRPT